MGQSSEGTRHLKLEEQSLQATSVPFESIALHSQEAKTLSTGDVSGNQWTPSGPQVTLALLGATTEPALMEKWWDRTALE